MGMKGQFNLTVKVSISNLDLPRWVKWDAQDNNTKGSLTSLQEAGTCPRSLCIPLKDQRHIPLHADPDIRVWSDEKAQTHALQPPDKPHASTIGPCKCQAKASLCTDSEWVGVNESKFPSVTFDWRVAKLKHLILTNPCVLYMMKKGLQYTGEIGKAKIRPRDYVEKAA